MTIDLVVEEDKIRVVGGSILAINSYARYKTEIVIGRQSSRTIAKMIRDNLAKNATKELRNKI